MDARCTCGAQILAEDSRFCHRCGRPLRDDVPEAAAEPAERREAALEPAAEAAAPDPAIINFHNGAAVRVGFLAAALVQLISTMSAAAGASLLLPLVLAGGGFYAVFLYRRRTGAALSVANGARIGWITGIFTFVIMTVFFTVGMALLAGSDQLMKAYKESAASFGLPPDAADQLQKLTENPLAFGTAIVLGLAFQFFLLTICCSLGGALGARLTRSRSV